MKKSLFGGAAAVAVLVALAMVFLVSNLNDLVAGVIEKQGSKVTATDVAVAGVDISLREGRGAVADLTIASPDGFATRQAFRLGGIAVDIDLESLRGDPLVIEEIRVEAPVVHAEFRRDGSSNIGVLQKHVQEYAARFRGDHDGGAGGGSGDGDQRRIRIKRFVFAEGRIEVDPSAMGLDARAVDLPAIRLDDIGGPEGALPAEIAQAVLGALTRKAATTVAQAELQDRVRDAVAEEAEKQGRNLLGRIGG